MPHQRFQRFDFLSDSWDLSLTLSQMTNFRLFQTEKSLQTTILKIIKMAENCPGREKTRWEMGKLIVTNNLSFSQIVFKRPVPCLGSSVVRVLDS